LLRMGETGGELILPMSFIPVAEGYDLMRTIDRWVVGRAFSDFRRLAKARENDSPAEFSIKLSGHTLSSPEFADFMREKLEKFGVSLGLQTIAEYVENEDIARKLMQIGVTTGQGFHLSPPRSWEALFGS